MIDLSDKCVTIRCSIEAAKRLRELEFVYEDADGDFSVVGPFAGFAWNEGETIGVFKLSPDFLECLCNGGYLAHSPSIEHTLHQSREQGGQVKQYSTMFPIIEVKRLNPNAPIPRFARDGDAGCDLCTMDEVEIAPQGTVMVHSGISVAIPRGFEGTLRPRSGMASKRGITLANAPSTIDSNYRGEVLLPLYNQGHETAVIKAGERVCQLLIKLQPEPNFVEVEEFTDAITSRGASGFGSSGYGRL